RENFELHQAAATVTHGGADTVRARVAAADHNHVLAVGGYVLAVGVVAVEQALGVGVQELHREMNAAQVPAFNGQIARQRSPAAKHDGVKGRLQIADCRLQIGSHFCNLQSAICNLQ